MLFTSNNAHIYLHDQTLHLIHVFELWVVLLVKFFFETLQQVLSVSGFFVILGGHKQSHAGEFHLTVGKRCVCGRISSLWLTL